MDKDHEILESLYTRIVEDYEGSATLIWLEKDGTIYDTEDTQHGLYVADNSSLFGVGYNQAKRLFDKYGDDRIDDAAAIMCEKAFQKKWMRVVKVPWNKKIFVEGQEPTKSQRIVIEDWYFENTSWDVIWQRWVSSKYGPAKPVTLFHAKEF